MDNTMTIALGQALIYMPLMLGMYLTYHILKVTDLTVEATFVMGAAVYARATSSGLCNQTEAIIIALLACSFVGAVVAAMQRITKIDSLIASVLAIFMLYSVNFKIMGVPNINLLNQPMILSHLQVNHPYVLYIALTLIALIVLIALHALLKSPLGLELRAYGENPKLISTLDKHTLFYLVIGLALSNLLAALSGIMSVQLNGYADLTMGTGVGLTAIGALIIGMKIMKRTSALHHVVFSPLYDGIAAFIGIFLYFTLMNELLSLGVDPVYLKLLLGLALIACLSARRTPQEIIYG